MHAFIDTWLGSAGRLYLDDLALDRRVVVFIGTTASLHWSPRLSEQAQTLLARV